MSWRELRTEKQEGKAVRRILPYIMPLPARDGGAFMSKRIRAILLSSCLLGFCFISSPAVLAVPGNSLRFSISFPRERSARSIAHSLPMASPSGVSWHVMMKRFVRRMNAKAGARSVMILPRDRRASEPGPCFPCEAP